MRDICIRTATLPDIPHVLHHRSSMYVDMGRGSAAEHATGSPDDATGRRALVQNVYTEPAFRRQGLARRLMATAIAWCRDQGLRSVSLHASDIGRPLYEDLGFRQTNEMRLLLK